MGTTGLIYAAIAFAWLAYLIPNYLRRKEDVSQPESDPHDRFSDSMRIIRSGSAPLLDQDLEVMGEVEVSTPLTRRAAIRELRRLERDAAMRRRRVLLALMIMLTAAVVVWVMHLAPWWTIAIPGGLVIAFFGVSRFTVAAMHRQLDERFARIRAGSDEATVVLNRRQVADLIKDVTVTSGGNAQTDKQSGRTQPGGLWDPLPITMPTYVSKPLAPRTVRTIDLSAPELSVQLRTGPVTADRPTPEVVSTPDQVVEVAKPTTSPEQTDQSADEHDDQAAVLRRASGA
ncbi:hypothetical protein GCM10011575_42930 [Microlunatus endophyticus]|uniref:Uncharacterized protein n=1 Tax=Microlunatus endophyticus TaxID=1716077 RepID=A0A917SG07_9ACTN|nr:hypothetical protein [Microlunatus endophyticus]GGL80088.1 hypothetical protein GCM10011575_42930 [Microlunatus endophyticus]